MARLADIEVELTLGMSGFNRDLVKAQKEINETTRRLNKSTKDINKSFSKSFQGVGKGLNTVGGHFDKFSTRSSEAVKITADELLALPEHLRGAAVRATGQSKQIEKSLNELPPALKSVSEAVRQTAISFNDFGKASKSSERPLELLNSIREKAIAAKFAMLGLNETGKVKISTAEATNRINEFNISTYHARTELERLHMMGGASTATEGLRQLAEASADVNKTFGAIGRGGSELNKVFSQMGIFSQDASDAVVLSMERMKSHFLRSNDAMMAKSTQAQGIISLTDGITYYGLSRQLLKLGDSLERRAREGTALNLALKRVGKDAPFATIAAETKKIQAGIGRLPGYVMGMGIAFGVVNYGLINLSNEIDGRLKPAFEDLKGTWADALEPFINVYTDVILKIMEFGQALGDVMKNLAETNPLLSQMIWGFLYLTLAFSLLLAPLAVGIGLTGGLAASFTLLWAAIGPFVLAFLTVVGVAMLVAAAIVVLVVAFKKMWENSEKFRSAVTGAWEGIKKAVLDAVAPLKAKWDELKAAFQTLMDKLTGNNNTSAGEFWKWLGDIMGGVVNQIATILTPLISVAFKVIAMAFGWVISAITFLVKAFTFLLPIIIPIVKATWDTVTGLIQGAVDVIVGIFNFFKALFTGDWKGMWEAVKQIISGAWNAIVNYFLLFGGKIIALGLKIGIGILKFVLGAFGKLLKGIISYMVRIVGAVGKWFGSMYTKGASIVSKFLSSIGKYFGRIVSTITSKVKGAYNAVVKWFEEMRSKALAKVNALSSRLSTVFGNIKKTASDLIGRAKTAVVEKFESMRSGAVGKANKILSGVKSAFDKAKSAITKPIESAKSTVLKIIDKIVGAFSRMKITIPTPDLPNINIGMKEKTIAGKKVKVPSFTLNAKGGVFNGASLLGGNNIVGEAGSEAVLPIEHKRYMAPFANAIASNIEKRNGSTEKPAQVIYQINMPNATIREEADVQKIVNEMERRRKIQERSRGVIGFG